MRYFPFCIDLGPEYHYSLPATSTVPDFWAVLIGIDGYSTNPLRGCVADALEMNDYLLN